jgi:hypothetical protein
MLLTSAAAKALAGAARSIKADRFHDEYQPGAERPRFSAQGAFCANATRADFIGAPEANPARKQSKATENPARHACHSFLDLVLLTVTCVTLHCSAEWPFAANRPGERGIILIRLGGEMTAFAAKGHSAEQ